MRFATGPRSRRSSRAAAAGRKPRCETDDGPGLRYAMPLIVSFALHRERTPSFPYRWALLKTSWTDSRDMTGLCGTQRHDSLTTSRLRLMNLPTLADTKSKRVIGTAREGPGSECAAHHPKIRMRSGPRPKKTGLPSCEPIAVTKRFGPAGIRSCRESKESPPAASVT